MKLSKRSKTLATSWLIACLLMLPLGTTRSWTGCASAQEDLTALLDSTQTAFFLLKYDYDVLAAKSEGKAKTDSVILVNTIEYHEQKFEEYKKQRNRELLIIAVTAITVGALTAYVARAE